MSRAIGFKISNREADEITAIYNTLNFGATRAVKSWMYLRRCCIYALKRVFTAGELLFILNMRSGRTFDPKFADKNLFIQEIKEYEKFDNTKTNVSQLCEKIEQLFYPYTFFLMDWADCFWSAKKEIKPEEYIKELL